MEELQGLILQADDLMQKAVKQEVSSIIVIEMIQTLARHIMLLREDVGRA